MNMETSPKSSETHTVRNIFIGLVGGLALVAVVNFIYTRTSATDFKKLNEGNWRTESVGAPYVMFDSPVRLTDTSRPSNATEREFIEYQMSYNYKEGRDLIIVATVINYHTHVYIDPLAAEQSVKGLEQLYGATNISYETTPLTIGGYPSKRVSGRFQIGDQSFIYARVNIVNKSLVRDLLVIVKDGDAQAARFLDRMVSSVGVQE
jgi:hypothetical protein